MSDAGNEPPRADRPADLPVARKARAPGRVLAAWIVALSADALQLGLFPIFGAGAASPFDGALDLGVAIALSVLLGWHWAFLPSFAAELIPFVDLVPSWTLACWIVTRGKKPSGPPAPRSGSGDRTSSPTP